MLPGLMKGFKGMEKFGLSSFFPSDELNIIDQQDVHFSIFISEFVHLFITDRIDHFIGELFRSDVTEFFYFGEDSILNNMVSDGVEEMGLP